jgi:hypothetical protein
MANNYKVGDAVNYYRHNPETGNYDWTTGTITKLYYYGDNSIYADVKGYGRSVELLAPNGDACF